jgi:predicted ATPase
LESFFSEREPYIHITCDFDLTTIPHPFVAGETLKDPLLRYEVEIGFRDRILEIQSEKLTGRTAGGKRLKSFVTHEKNGKHGVSLNRDTALSGKTRHFSSPSPRSVLTMIDDAELYPHVVALTRELSSWRFFHFEPEALREPSPAMDILELEPDGRGLSGFYDTLNKREPERFKSAERALQRVIPEARNIRVWDTGDRRRLLAIVREDGREFVARVLSDGTLRFLALIALAYAPQPPSLVCFEEPENGVHPGRLQFVVDILRGISERTSNDGRRWQVLVNSHSPYLVDLLDPSEMLLALLKEKGKTFFHSVGQDLFSTRPVLKDILESGEQTLGELWSQGSLDAEA